MGADSPGWVKVDAHVFSLVTWMGSQGDPGDKKHHKQYISVPFSPRLCPDLLFVLF